MYRSRPARAEERYTTYRFPSGSVGFIAPGDPATAICMACDTTLQLAKLPEHLRSLFGEAEAKVTFVRLEPGPYHDGIRFPNGKEVSLQMLGPGVDACVIDPLMGPGEDAAGTAEPRQFETVS
jgi:hypothetical protein